MVAPDVPPDVSGRLSGSRAGYPDICFARYPVGWIPDIRHLKLFCIIKLTLFSDRFSRITSIYPYWIPGIRQSLTKYPAKSEFEATLFISILFSSFSFFFCFTYRAGWFLHVPIRLHLQQQR